jgi:hypothetical protein
MAFLSPCHPRRIPCGRDLIRTNDSEFAGGVRLDPRSKDPLVGTQEPAESVFVMPQAGGGPPIEVTGFSSFVTTMAAAYVFLPSITAIGLIANSGEGL